MSNQNVEAVMNEVILTAENFALERDAEVQAIGSLLKHYDSPTMTTKDSLAMLSKVPDVYSENSDDLRKLQADLQEAAENSRNAAYWFREASENMARSVLLAKANTKISTTITQLDKLRTEYMILDPECKEAKQIQDKIKDLKAELVSQTVLFELLKV